MAAASKTSRTPEARAISRPWPRSPKPVTSVAARIPAATSTSAAARFSRRMDAIADVEVGRRGPPLAGPGDQEAGPERLRQQQHVAGPGASLAQEMVGVADADHGQAELRLRVADGVPPGERPAGLADDLRRAADDGRHHLRRQLLREGRHGEGEEHPPAHREDVGAGVGGGDRPERRRVVNERRKEVHRPDDGEVVRQAIDGGVVGRRQAGDQLRRRGRGAEAGEDLGQHVRSQLRRAPAAVGQVGQRDRGGVGRDHGRDDTGRRRRAPPRATIRRTGAVGSRWAPRSSKPVRSRVTRPGGFDSHALPPRELPRTRGSGRGGESLAAGDDAPGSTASVAGSPAER